MKPRKTGDLIKTLSKKGFKLIKSKKHHSYFYLHIDGIKHNIHTYFSHGLHEYDKNLMGEIKKQLKFKDSEKAEEFFDCPMSGDDYVKMLESLKEI